jgi:hypothetical protein
MVGAMSLTRRKPLKRQSKKRAKESKVYMDKRKAFLGAHPFCQWWLKENGVNEGLLLDAAKAGMKTYSYYGPKSKEGDFTTTPIPRIPRSSEVHHRRGRRFGYYLDDSTWMAVSTKGHRWIHAHPKESREKGYILF